jgi:hypothetical protein
MATTRNQELQTSFYQTHVSIEHLTSQMDSTHSRIDKLEHKFNNMEANLTTQLTSLQSVVNQLLNHPTGPSSSDLPDVVDSSQSLYFHSNSFHREPYLPRVKVNKFDGSNPTGWVTQMEHYFSLHGITDELAKLRYGVLYLLAFYLGRYSAYFVLKEDVTLCLHYQTLHFVMGFYKVVLKWFFY